MKTPTVEQLQAWTQLWDEAKRYQGYQKAFEQASDTSEIRQVVDDLVNQVGQEGLGQDPIDVEQVVDNLVNQVELQDQEAQSIQKAKVFEVVAGEHIAHLIDELDRALRDLGLEPPWSTRNSTSGLYRTDEHVIPLTIRLLDGLRLSKASRYADFAESDHPYGCKSPFTYSYLEVNERLDERITQNPERASHLYQHALARRIEMTEYIDELTSRLFNLNVDIMQIPAEKKPVVKQSIYTDVSKLMARTEGDTLASIDAKMIEKTVSLVDRLMVNYFSTWREELTDEENAELQIETRSKVEQVFKQFNQEKNAERHLSDCFDLAFCAKASESDQSAAHLQALKDSGIKNISGVLRGASVDSARTLYDFPGSEHDLIDIAKYAVKISSYGLLRATLEAIAKNNAHINFISRHVLIANALINSEASIIKQCLRIESTCSLRDCSELWQFVLLNHAVRADVHSAGVRANEHRLQMLLNAGVNINAELGKRTLLMDYCKSGYVAEAIKLIEAGANVNAVDDGYGHGMTVLMTASMNGYEGLVKALIDAGAELNMCDQYGQTALIHACSSHKKKTVQMLVEAGADTNTALIYACKKGREHVVGELIDAEIDINVKDENGLTALIHACLNYNIHNVKMLIGAGADVNVKDNSGMTALMHASLFGSVGVEELLKSGAYVNTKDNNGDTALMYACEDGKEAVVTKLIEAGADVNTRNEQSETALMYACGHRSHGHGEIVKKLLEAKADINIAGSFGHTPLTMACIAGNETVVEAMISHGVDVDVKGRHKQTALMIACDRGHETVISKLIEARVDVNARNNWGQTALMVACGNGDEAEEVVGKLIEAGADVNAKDNDGDTALMYACAGGHGDIVSQLIQAGADVNAKDGLGQTALMNACSGGHDNVVSRLLEAGADVNTKDSKGKTAYDYAVDKGYADLENRVIALESVGTRANRIARETGEALGSPAVLTALAGITTAAMYASGSLDTALESASQAMPDIVSAATNATSQALTELTTAAIEIGRQIGYGPGL
jgi:ankyrin repeat protein